MRERSANVYFNGIHAGRLAQTADGCLFAYNRSYLKQPHAQPISLTLPLNSEPYTSPSLFHFFRGLIPEGWLFELNARALKIDSQDEFGMLLHTGRDCIGAVTVIAEAEDL